MRPLSFIVILSYLFISTCAGHAGEIVFATLNDNVRKQFDRFSRLEVYLERELEDAGVTNVTLEVFQEPELLSRSLKNEKIDFYFDSPLVAAAIGQPAGAELFLRRWKRGVGKYHSVIFVKSGSDINSLDDLRGSNVAMQDPTSTSGYLLPVSILTGAGIAVSEVENQNDIPVDDTVGYIFTGDDKNTALWVAKGFVEAGATDNVTFSQLQKVAPGQYRSLARSMELPRQVLLKHKSVDPVVAQKVAEVLTSMHETEEGRKILRKFNKTTKFERFEAPPEQEIAPLVEILDTLTGANMIEW